MKDRYRYRNIISRISLNVAVPLCDSTFSIMKYTASGTGTVSVKFINTLCLALHSGGCQRPPGSSWGKSASMPAQSGTSSRVTGNLPSSPGGIIGHSDRGEVELFLLTKGDAHTEVDDNRED